MAVREEASSKNPIFVRLSTTIPHTRREWLVGRVTAARDFFHTFIAQSVRRRYQRVPIYLVDPWLPHILGLFTRRRGVRRPPPGEDRPTWWLEQMARLFQCYEALDGPLSAFELLDLDRPRGDLAYAIDTFAQGESQLKDLEDAVAAIERILTAAVAALGRDETVKPYALADIPREIARRIDALRQAARSFASTPPEQVPGLSFEPDRGAGLLFVDIHALDIRGPAILIAPATIKHWAAEHLAPHSLALQRREAGTPTPNEVADEVFDVGLANVLFHELTHAMLALPNDLVGHAEETEQSRMDYFVRFPGFEEGLANCTAAICTATQVLKNRLGLVGNSLPALGSPRFEDEVAQLIPLMNATYTGYHQESTEVFMTAWHANKRDYGAFAGMLKMYATNFARLRWDETFEALGHGRIATSGE